MKYLFIVSLFLSFLSLGQNVQEKFLHHVEILCSDSLAGRGYVEKGDFKAANYIKSEFQKYELKPIDNDFFQHFELQVNVFDSNSVALRGLDMTSAAILNSPNLEIGKDYIVKACSKPQSGEFTIHYLDSIFFAKKRNLKKFTKGKGFEPRFVSKNAFAYDKANLNANLPTSFIERLRKSELLIEIAENPILGIDRNQSCNTTILATKAGFEKMQQASLLSVSISPELKKHRSQNVIGYIEGEIQDTFLIVSAHYDHLGKQGKAIFPGANDNASGTAAMLTLAESIAAQETKPKYSIAFIAFGAEEAGLVGSFYYVQNPMVPLAQTRFVLNLDLMGSGSEGITVVNGTEYPHAFNLLDSLANLEKPYSVKKRGPAANSDHYPFYQKGVPAFFIYARGKVGGYHNVYDIPEKIEQRSYPELHELFLSFIKRI